MKGAPFSNLLSEEDEEKLEATVVAWFEAFEELGCDPYTTVTYVRLATRLGRWSYLGARC